MKKIFLPCFFLINFHLHATQYLNVLEIAPGKSLLTHLENIYQNMNSRKKRSLEPIVEENIIEIKNITGKNNSTNETIYKNANIETVKIDENDLKSLYQFFKEKRSEFTVIKDLKEEDFLNPIEIIKAGKKSYGTTKIQIIKHFLPLKRAQFTQAFYTINLSGDNKLALKIIETENQIQGHNEIENLKLIPQLLQKLRLPEGLAISNIIKIYQIDGIVKKNISNNTHQKNHSIDIKNQPISSEELSKIYYNFGCLIAQFHLLNMDEKTMIENNTEKITRENIHNFYKTIVHGDLHPGNVKYDLKKYYLIDVETLSQSKDAKFSIFVDIGRFVLQMFSLGDNFFIRRLVAEFLKGYLFAYDEKYQSFLKKLIIENSTDINFLDYSPSDYHKKTQISNNIKSSLSILFKQINIFCERTISSEESALEIPLYTKKINSTPNLFDSNIFKNNKIYSNNEYIALPILEEYN